MAGLPHISMNDAKTIKVITKKLHFNNSSLMQLQAAQKAGISTEQAVANLLGLEDGQDPKSFIQERLTDTEYEVLKRILGSAKDGSFLN